jgi:hypothetical protein
MVYVNTFNAFIGLGLILVISVFIIFVAYLWIQNLESKAQEQVAEEFSKHVCNCLTVISDNGRELVVMNVNCLYVENLLVQAGDEYYSSPQTLYYEDFFLVDYVFKPRFYVVSYNNCTETLN